MMEETDKLQNTENVPENVETPVLPNPENRERDLQEANPTIQPEENTPENVIILQECQGYNGMIDAICSMAPSMRAASWLTILLVLFLPWFFAISETTT